MPNQSEYFGKKTNILKLIEATKARKNVTFIEPPYYL